MPRKKEGQKLIEEAQHLYTQKKYSDALDKLTEARNLPAWNLYSDTWHSIAQDLNTAIDKALIREREMREDDGPVIMAQPVLSAETVPVDKYEERNDAERRFGHIPDPEPEPEPEYVGGPVPGSGWDDATHTPGGVPVYQNKKPNKPKKPKKPKKGTGCCGRPQEKKRKKKKTRKKRTKKRTKKRKPRRY